MDTGLLELFREESLERVDRMAATLLSAEADGGGGAETIAQLFREAHSIKGSAGMFGLDQVGALAGTMEDVLARSREHGALSPEMIPALLGAVDAVRAAVSDDLRGLEPAAAALRAIGTDGPPAAPPRDPAALEAVDPHTETPARDSHPPRDRTLRVRADKIDRLLASVGETALHSRRLARIAVAAAPRDEPLLLELDRGRMLIAELKEEVLDLRTLPLETIVGGLRRAVRDAAAEVGREVRLELTGTSTPLDRSVLDGISDALVHLLRNAVSHGIEAPDERAALGKPRTGAVRIAAEQRGEMVALTCHDDGRGVSAEVLARVPEGGSLADLLSEAGFSTAKGVSELAGRGVGLDAVARHVERLGGVLEVSSTPGVGTAVTLLVPLTLAVVNVMLVERGGQVLGVPLSGVDRATDAPGALELDAKRTPVADLADVLRMDASALGGDAPVVVIVSGSRQAAVECDRRVGDREVLVKTLGPLLSPIAGYMGAAVLDDGRIALLLDPAHIVRVVHGPSAVARKRDVIATHPAPKVLVVDDQFSVRELGRTILESAGYRVSTAHDGLTALGVLDDEDDIECVVSDVEMPRMSGLDLLEAIRAQPGRAALPVIIVTSRDDDRALQRGADAGADAWMVKSQFEQDALLEIVGRLIGTP